MDAIWVEFIGNLYSSLLSVGLITYLFGRKYRGIRGYGAAAAAVAVYYGVIVFLNYNYQFEGLAAILYGLVLFVYGCLALKGRAEYKVVFCVAWNCALLLTALGSFVLLHFLTGWSIHDMWLPLGSARTVALLYGCLIKGVIALAIAMRKRFGPRYSSAGSGWRRALGLLSYFLLSLEAFLMMMEVMIQGEGTALLLVFYIVLAGLFLILLYAFYQSMMGRRESREAQYLRESMEQQAAYIRSFSRLCQGMRLLRHDARGHLVTVHILLKEGKRQQAAAYLEGIAKPRNPREDDERGNGMEGSCKEDKKP